MPLFLFFESSLRKVHKEALYIELVFVSAFCEMLQCLCAVISGDALYKPFHEQESVIISLHQLTSILTLQSNSTVPDLSNLTIHSAPTLSTTTHSQQRQCVDLLSPTGAAGAGTKPNYRAPRRTSV